MGKWSANRRRGSAPPGGAFLPTPEAPTLFDDEGDFKSNTFNATNVNGSVRLKFAVVGEGPFSEVMTMPWSIEILWGQTGDFDSGFYQAIAIGGEVNFRGESAPSATYEMP